MKGMTPVLVLVMVLLATPVNAQEAAVQPTGQKSLAATMNVYVFPTKNQTQQDQNTDEASCYGWAVQNTGSDPFELGKKAQADQQQAATAMQQTEYFGRRSGAHGAVHGAAVGALIGEIASDDAGKGAAYGAAAGLISGRRHGRRARHEAQTAVATQSAQNQQHTTEQLENFKKAFSVCLEAKSYMVKY